MAHLSLDHRLIPEQRDGRLGVHDRFAALAGPPDGCGADAVDALVHDVGPELVDLLAGAKREGRAEMAGRFAALQYEMERGNGCGDAHPATSGVNALAHRAAGRDAAEMDPRAGLFREEQRGADAEPLRHRV